MRLKISTIHPLSLFKAWFVLGDETHTIEQLKRALCARLPIGMQADNITLVMDEYDLLDESPISILRDGDAVCIKRTVVASRPGLSSNRVPLPATQKRKRRASTSSEPSSSSSSSSSSSDSSDDSSSSSSSSDSDTDSDTDVPKPPRRPVGRRVIATTKSKTLQDNVSSVPPGYGKPSTRNRNLRRRRKRVAEHNQPNEHLAPTSGANAILPLPIQQNSLTRTSSEAYVADAEPESEPNVMMVSLRNKNKKKNFRQLMVKPLPPKIVFAELENAPVQTGPPDKLSPAVTSNSEKVAVHPVKRTGLIPPSERDGIPSNIFVTSVDVEEGKWPKKGRSKGEFVAASYDNESCTANFSLDYASAEVPMANQDEALYLRAEQQWDLLPKIANASQVKADIIVAYKALAINPTTWTPEMLMKVARVISLSSTHVTTSPLQRPAAQVSFSGLIDVIEADEEDETYTWADVLSQEWRVVQ